MVLSEIGPQLTELCRANGALCNEQPFFVGATKECRNKPVHQPACHHVLVRHSQSTLRFLSP